MSTNITRNQYQGRRIYTETIKLLKAKCAQVWVKTPEKRRLRTLPILLWVSIPLFFQVLKVNITENFPYFSSKGRETDHSEIHQSILFLKNPTLKRNYFISPKQLVFYQRLTQLWDPKASLFQPSMWDRGISNSSPLEPSHPTDGMSRGWTLRSMWEFTPQGSEAHWAQITGQLAPDHHTTKGGCPFV